MSAQASAGHGLKHLGWGLVFAIVYADIGTSIFYVPGILYHSIGNLATLAQILATTVFVSIALKYVEICDRCPDGGGVVSVTRLAFSKWTFLPLLGGAFITVDYFLTSALSGVSGLYYLATLLPGAKEWVLPVSAMLFLGLAVLNIVGLRESAVVIAWLAGIQIVVALALVAASALGLDAFGSWSGLVGHVVKPEGELTPWRLLSGYAATWLAFSGLESASQVSGAMKPPVHRTAMRAMILVILFIAILSPVLTAFSLYFLPAELKLGDPEALLSELAFRVGGAPLGIATVLAAAALLFMACNTAMVGNYHVNYRLSELGFLPGWLRKRHARFGTPHVSIILSAAIPLVILVLARGSIHILGDLYAFGLLGTLSLSSLSVDVLRWRDGRRGIGFWWGAVTTGLLLLAWFINMINKPYALLFGGLITAALMVTGLRKRSRVEKEAEEDFEEAEHAAADTPEAEGILTLEEAEEARGVESATHLVSLRYANPKLLAAAARSARGERQANIYVVFVDEAPGLYTPLDVRPSKESLRVLADASRALAAEGMTAIPVWRLAEDAGRAVADAATRLQVTSVFVGSSRRTFFWRMLRGRMLQRLASLLPDTCNLIVVG